MMKVLKINLGGVERELDFGKFWFQKFYGEATGKDPLNGSEILLTPDGQFDFVVALVYAGLKTTCKVQKKEPDFTKEDIQDWVGEKESEEIVNLISEYMKLTAPGELVAP